MKDESSIFDAEPENLDRLVFEILGEPEAEEDSSTEVTKDGILEQPGGQIGRYKLLSILGEGGMGIVYLAEQERPIKRRIALKVIKPGMDSKRVVARFEAERQALALLDHPNIAHVHDAGTTEAGRPYFVMEYVKGLPITEYCDCHKLTIENRLNLFQQVCLAVNHAHQKGIIHRDIKPSNILVSTQDDQAVPKIIDFGVAKALSMPLTERTLATEDSQLLGTPEYMSPEQADMASEDIDTRSDIYSLGVLLYVLLTGVLPFESDTLREGGIEHIRQIIRETDPKTPSTRLAKLGEEARKVAENRRIEIATLAKCLHKELEWIPLKAMRKERTERYRSASELADDINNYLNGAPLLAGPESTVYLIKKFVKRKRALVMGIVAILVVLIVGIAISTIFAIGQARARTKAQQIAYASDMSLAQQALAMNDTALARRLLDAHRPAPGEVDLRGWEWRYLWQQCRSDALSVLCCYPPLASSVAYSPDGRALAVAGGPDFDRGGFIDIWDVPDRKRIATLPPKEGSRVAFSPRGDLLATNAGNQIRIWRTGTWDRIDHDKLTLDGRVCCLKFSPDGTRLASLSLPDEIAVWEVSQWAVVRRTRGGWFQRLFGDLDFSPDGKTLVIGDSGSRLKVIDLAGGNTIFNVPKAHPDHITAVRWSPNGSVIASGSGWEGGPIKLWDAASGKLLGELRGHTSWICELVFSTDGQRLYSASGDQTIRIWEVEQRQCLATLRGSSNDVLGLALSPDGTTLASACKDGVVAFWSADPPPEDEMPRLIPLGQSDRARPVFAPDSRVLAVPRAGTVSLFDLATSKETENIPELGNDVSTIAYSPDGTLLVSGSEKGRVRVWSCAGHCLLRELDIHKESILLLRFRSDGKRLLSIDAQGAAIWWDVPTWRTGLSFSVKLPVRVDKPPNNSRPESLSSDGRLLAFGDMGAMRWLNAETGELLMTTTGGDRPTMQVAFSGDDSQVVSTSTYGSVAFWDSSTYKLSTKLDGHVLGSFGVAFSPDGRRVATGGGTSRDAIKLWDLLTRRELITLPGQSTVFWFVAFSNDGRWLAAYNGREGDLNLWHAPSWEEIEAEEKKQKNYYSKL